jgi:hypothetical protein
LKALGTNTPFLSRVSALGLKPSGGYSRQNGVSALAAFKTGQAHLVRTPGDWSRRLNGENVITLDAVESRPKVNDDADIIDEFDATN